MTLAQFTLPPDTRAVGTGNPPADMNGVTDAHNAMGAAYNVLNTAYAGGADPTGTNDSTTAINDAITAVESAGGTVFIPPGLYKISGALNLASGVVLQGYGQNATVIQQTSTTAPGFTSAGARYCGIRDLMIEGPNSGSGIGIYFNYSSGPAVAHIDLRNLRVYQFGGAGVNLQTPIVCTVTNVRSESNGGNGFTAANGTSIKWDACYATGNGGNGYEFDTMTYYAAQGCAADSNSGIAYLVNGGGNGGFLGCGGESNTGNGFEITGSACVTLASCYISGNNGIGFWVTGSSSQIMLMGPRETTPTGNATASVQVDAGSNAVLMTPTYTTALNLHANTTAQMTPQGITAPGVGGTGSMAADRATTSNFSTFQLNTTGAEIWSWGMKNDSTNDMHLRDADRGLEVIHVQERATMNNIGFLGQPSSYGGGVGVGFLANANTAPSSSPSGGGYFYSSGGEPYWYPSSGGPVVLGSSFPLCAPNIYAPGSQTTAAVSSTTLAAFDSGVICTNSFTAPASGDVLVTLHCLMQQSAGGDTVLLALGAKGTVTPVVGYSTTIELPSTTLTNAITVQFYVTGLTAGSSYQFDLLGAAQSGTTATIYAQGLTALTVGVKGGPVVMSVQGI